MRKLQSLVLTPDFCAHLMSQFLSIISDIFQLVKFNSMNFSSACSLIPILSKTCIRSLILISSFFPPLSYSTALIQSPIFIPFNSSIKFIFFKTLARESSIIMDGLPPFINDLYCQLYCFSQVQAFSYFSNLYLSFFIFVRYSFIDSLCILLIIILVRILESTAQMLILINSTQMQEKSSLQSPSNNLDEGKQLLLEVNKQESPKGDNAGNADSPNANLHKGTNQAENKQEGINQKLGFVWKQDQSYGFDYAISVQTNSDHHTHSVALAKILKTGHTMADIEKWIKLTHSVHKELWLLNENKQVVSKLKLTKYL